MLVACRLVRMRTTRFTLQRERERERESWMMMGWIPMDNGPRPHCSTQTHTAQQNLGAGELF